MLKMKELFYPKCSIDRQQTAISTKLFSITLPREARNEIPLSIFLCHLVTNFKTNTTQLYFHLLDSAKLDWYIWNIRAFPNRFKSMETRKLPPHRSRRNSLLLRLQQCTQSIVWICKADLPMHCLTAIIAFQLILAWLGVPEIKKKVPDQ